MARIVLVTGGCRSGKSSYALVLGQALGAKRGFIATCQVTDEEMHARIEAHRQARAKRGWQTMEEPCDLAALFRRCSDYDVLLVDCITVWINNLMHFAALRGEELTEADISQKCQEVLDVCAACSGTVIFVSNEVGLGIVPENALARRYRDLVGRANQTLAERAASVTLMVCGIPWRLKKEIK